MRNISSKSFLSLRHIVGCCKVSCITLSHWGITTSFRRFGQPASQTHPHLIAEGEVTPGITRAEYHQRRCKLVQAAVKTFRGVKSVKDHLFIFPSSTTSYMTNDIPYPFRQNTDFLYFSGFLEPDSLLLIEANHKSVDGAHVSHLFVPRRDPSRELWDGPRSGTDGAIKLTGVDASFTTGELGKYLQYYNHQHKDYVLWYNHGRPVHADFHHRILEQVMKDQKHKCVENPTMNCHKLRALKSPAEVQLMQRSADIASEAFMETMKFSRPMVNEAHLWAKMDFECRIRGAEFLAYPPVVAGGTRANIIHYITNNQVIVDGDLVLMDAGCELHGYASDLTRTWPVSGKFTKPQKELYNATLRVQEACIKLCTNQYSLDELFHEMLLLLAEELTHLGIIAAESSPEEKLQLARKFCPHHVGHYLGMDVHDTSTMSRKAKLKPNMVITIEPGIYIREDDFTVSPEYRGIGIRVEDNILITDSAPLNLSASCPKEIEEIEGIMAARA
ncbi:xaa-Pro aminopeptidase 3 [Aplysia californica]|uniref:Xaa-Pro aminopeptidase 3 n=1 Tax=Aplysia californica TaxID=6500 RepID=A0ABM0JZY2_APLCA|nr:xaa-Pro aminopeptidase 3 [Aplysia californica]